MKNLYLQFCSWRKTPNKIQAFAIFENSELFVKIGIYATLISVFYYVLIINLKKKFGTVFEKILKMSGRFM